MKLRKTRTHSGKINKLTETVRKELAAEDTQKWVLNLTEDVTPPEVLNIIKFGPKFCVKTKTEDVPFDDIVASVEASIQRVKSEYKGTTRNSVCNILNNYKLRPAAPNAKDAWIQQGLEATKKYLKQNKDTLVVRADKGEVSVLISKDSYNNKMYELLSDVKVYQKTSKDNTKSVEAKCNKFLSGLQARGGISERKGTYLRRYNSVTAKMYGLIKTHKTGHPIRPIVASRGAPTYNLSKEFSNTIRRVVGNTERNIKNATDLRNRLKTIKIPKNYILISLDVKSLFTNIPNDLVYDGIRKRWREIRKHTELCLEDFVNGVKLVLENNSFQFNKEFFTQISGSPMGSPMSPAVADLVLEILESVVLSRFMFCIPFFFRYVDDIFLAVPKNKVDLVLEEFNAYDANLQFTCEEERDGRIAFLDLWLIRNTDGTISTDWFHKETWSGRYLNFASNMPRTYKRNTITILARKILELSDERFHANNFKLLTDTLKSNGYPDSFVQSTLDNFRKNFKNNSGSRPTTPDLDNICVLPYIKGMFEKLKHSLRKSNIWAVAKGHNNLKDNVFSKLKDKTPITMQSNLIYEVKCECEMVYIGQTCRRMEKRLYEHKYHTSIGDGAHSALCEHLIQSGHNPTWDDFNILKKENNSAKLNIHEMIHIKRTTNTLNKQTDSVFLPNGYNTVLNII